ncbi:MULTISPECIES: alternate-type signal peptide domain-containing protein [unclassified Nocardioides]|uniref:alternate-type signal peptide domain-containing protein n=1 Tax=unclassified Nocardioides TaxID=2615069 RepID=UPI0006FE46F9|nr:MULTISPECIES: alternate-type signal peptide domain-containing protein [unclassified Nocardioides]KRA32648.1 hypothetical protein ASD81_14065 [Nocardioides sp. Root614]KRA89301.1 hypothetical protein ASD84_14330 [Nocardioides sp. Root682]
MKKSTKGALAAGSAAVLLMGGAGTLAFWTATDDVDGGSIDSGSLTLTTGTCDGWVYSAADLEGTGPVTLVVPGDTIEQTCEVTIDGSGDHLKATVEIDPASVADITLGTGVTDTLTVSAALVGATTDVEIDGPTTVDVVITVAYPYGATENNDSQLSTATLGAITLDAVQVHD